jgi:phospholipid/cholesterol/gamma-HCH transport system substrate-binding protein
VNDKKHLIVGLFVLLGAVLLGTMIVWFKGGAIFEGGYSVSVHLDSAVGIRAGKRVHLDGIECGEVLNVESSAPEARGVWVEVRVNRGFRIPANARFVAQQSAMGGDAFMDFRTVAASADFLEKGARVYGEVVPPSILPDDLVANFKELIAPRTIEEVGAGKPANLASALAQMQVTSKAIQDEFQQPESEFRKFMVKAGQSAEELTHTLKTVQDTLDKPDSNFNLLLTEGRQTGKDISATVRAVNEMLATLRVTAETYTKAGASLQETSDEAKKALALFAKDADEVSVLVKNLNTLVENTQKGKGTLGQFVTSDELHRQLVNLVENLQKMTDNGNRLITMWREQGVFAKEGK